MSSKINFPTIPAFYTDPNFATAQNTLLNTGSNLLAGNPGSYYGMIGDVGGPAFEDVLRMKNRDIQTNVLEGAAKMGTPSGASASAIAKATADSDSTLRWNNVLQAISGRQSLLNAGLSTVQGVDSNALNYGGQKNQYSMEGANLETQQATSQAELEAQQKLAQQSMWASIIGGVAGGATNLYGMNMLSGMMKGGGSAVSSAAATGGGLATDPFQFSNPSDFYGRIGKSVDYF